MRWGSCWRLTAVAMSEDEQVDLVTLTWLGRGDGTLADWDELRAEAARVHNKRTASYLLGEPLLPDYLGLLGLAQYHSPFPSGWELSSGSARLACRVKQSHLERLHLLGAPTSL